jgi:hypothetical protein
MADFYPVQINPPPDMLAAYMRGAMAPGILQEQRQQLQAGQQGLETGAINLDMLRYMVGFHKQAMDEYQQGDDGSGGQPPQPLGQGGLTAGAQAQSGPQGAVQPSTDPLARSSINRDAQYARTMAYVNGTDPNAPMAVAQKLNADRLADFNNRQKLAAAPSEAALMDIVTSPHPERMIMNNAATHIPGWQAFAPTIARPNGKPIDPSDPQQMTPDAVRAAAITAINTSRARYGGEIMPMPPEYKPLYGPNGQFGQLQLGGKEGSGTIKELSQQQAPGYTPEISTDPNTSQKQATLLQTKPGGLPAFGGPGGGGMPGGNGTVPRGTGGGVGSVGAPVNVGFAAPTPETEHMATVADTFRTGMQNAQKMEQGPKPVKLTPLQMTVILNGISSEGGGKIIPGVEALGAYITQKTGESLPPNVQQYLASILPMVEAKISTVPRERINEGTIESAFKQLVPTAATDSAGMDQITRNRESIFRSQLSGAGSSAMSSLHPGLRDDVAAYRSGGKPEWLSGSSAPITKTIGGVTYEQRGGQ